MQTSSARSVSVLLPLDPRFHPTQAPRPVRATGGSRTVENMDNRDHLAACRHV
jgi:hypothetical protein